IHSAEGNEACAPLGCPIRIRSAHRSLAAPRPRFAALRVLRRPLAPRHPPRTPARLAELLPSPLRELPHDRLRPSSTSSHFGKIEANTRCGCERPVEPVGLTTEEWVARRVSACARAIMLGGTVTRAPAGVRPVASRSTWVRVSAGHREVTGGDGDP